MDTGRTTRDCMIMLHDDIASKEDVICGLSVLDSNEIGFLVAPNGRTLCIAPKHLTRAGFDEVFIHMSVARRFGFENRTKAKIHVLDNKNDAVATHVEITFRDQHLSRADMWRMKAQFEDRMVYKGQKLKYLGSHAAEVTNVYFAEDEVDSAVISHPRTKLIYRSYSARYTILIQISKEMLQYWHDGDLMFERLISGFLPDLFGRWETTKVRHQVTVIVFGRRVSSAINGDRPHGANSNQDSEPAADFFHVLVSEMPSPDWRLLLRKLKEVLQSARLPHDVCLASQGNLLEAIHLTAMDFADDNLAPPAHSTGTSIIAVTAGTGLFEADHVFLKRTTELLLGNSIGVDIVSLSPQPLHPVPLFQYDLKGSTEYALPHWLDISFWGAESHPLTHWLFSNCNEQIIEISLTPQMDAEDARLSTDAMSAHDDSVFSKQCDTLEHTLSHETVIGTPRKPTGHIKSSSRTSEHSSKWSETIDMQPDANTNVRTSDEDHRPSSASTASMPLMKRAKREGLPSHALMQNFRKISVGPKGLAPSQGVASTTVSAHHVQQERELPGPISSQNENPSLLARQIRDSLRRKPSQRTLASQQTHEPAEISRPIAIRTSDELQNGAGGSTHNESDPTSLIEKAVMDGESGPNSGSYSATPKLKRGSLPLPGLSSIDAQDGSNTPWLTLLNPCDPKRSNMRIASEYRKWQNVFPQAVSLREFKWDSMCSPASLPLMTEVRVSMTDLERHFKKKIRRILVTPGLSATNSNVQYVLHQLIALRLTAGFQIVPTRKLKQEQTAGDHIERIILALGSYYHELRHLSHAEIQVTEYERSSGLGKEDEDQSALDDIYAARVKPVISRRSHLSNIKVGGMPLIQDWSALDDQCANPFAASDEPGVCKMRFALIPVQPSESDRSTLSDEERRIDGIQKLTLMWQRHRFVAAEDQQHHASMVKPKGAKIERDPNPLAIEYVSRDPSAVVSGLSSTLTDPDGKEGETSAAFPESEKYHSSNFDISKLVRHLQEPPPQGIELRDRRWFTRLHFKCFRGDEMCNWILRVFKDLHTREDAVALGNQLMDREIFTHVRGKHEFRDGHYLYQIKGAYRTTDYPDTASLFSKGIGRSMPSTPLVERNQSPSIRAIQNDSDSSGRGTPTTASAPVGQKEKKALLLTERLRFNVDPNRKSDHLEVVDLHYDRIHNPENCYHVQLDWTTTTPKLIRESVAKWSLLVRGDGLKLVQLPVREVCKLHEQHPFDQAVSVKLALRPPKKIPATPLLTPHGASPSTAAEDPLASQKALLRKLDFVLDLEAASAFPKTVDISYSWGKPEFELTQFVHKSGLLLVQISDNGEADFLLLPNRLAPQPSASEKKADAVIPDDIVSKFKAFCKDEEGLKAFYSDLNKPLKITDLTSPFSQANKVADFDVPHMELPPHLMHRARS